ncbi:hypothetical protein RJ639_022671 [Escallonia herrerae]|uniref:Oxidative stress 3 n=1 Tax=Escallonia herrerae TaxID=1293975 RepID=A0AA89AE09_9ASTE|nr:hypothetical protein RJ639_022671 [Escallonia herrerae]
MISLEMGFASFNQLSNHGIMDEEGLDRDSVSSSSDVSSVASSESDSMEEVTSSASSSPSSGSGSPPSSQIATAPLNDMSSLLQQLPFKRGLSRHFEGKSQSFTSLSSVRCLEDLVKPENPYNKKLKSCRSYGGLLTESHKSSSHLPRNTSSRLISKKSSRGSCSSLIKAKKAAGSLLGNRPPMHPPHRSNSTSSFSNQTPLFA